MTQDEIECVINEIRKQASNQLADLQVKVGLFTPNCNRIQQLKTELGAVFGDCISDINP